MGLPRDLGVQQAPSVAAGAAATVTAAVLVAPEAGVQQDVALAAESLAADVLAAGVQQDAALAADALAATVLAAGVQQADALAVAASRKTGICASVWKCSQATPCGSVTQCFSLRA